MIDGKFQKTAGEYRERRRQAADNDDRGLMFRPLDGAEIAAVDVGTAPPLLLLRGALGKAQAAEVQSQDVGHVLHRRDGAGLRGRFPPKTSPVRIRPGNPVIFRGLSSTPLRIMPAYYNMRPPIASVQATQREETSR